MPFIRKIETSDGQIAIWQLTETADQLLSQVTLSDNEKAQYRELKAENRRKEFIATRILLSVLKEEKQKILHTSTGKPFLSAGKPNISISHSADYAVIFLSEKNTGIDVEQCTRNINRVADRFLSKKEKELIEKLDNQQFAKILFWAAKEAIFKCTNAKGIIFNEQILINTFIPGHKGCFSATLLLPERSYKYLLQYLTLENNVLVYCVEQEN